MEYTYFRRDLVCRKANRKSLKFRSSWSYRVEWAVKPQHKERGLSVKPGLRHWQTVQTQIRRHRIRCLIRVCTTCLNYRKLRVKRKSCPRSGPFSQPTIAGLGGSIGCAVRLKTRRSQVQPPPRTATFFRGHWSWNIFYGHSLPSADSRRAVVSFWRKNVHNTG